METIHIAKFPLKTVQFNFSLELRLLLKHDLRCDWFDYQFKGPQTVKHLIESLSIPHTEIGRILVNGETQGIDYLVQNMDRVEVSNCEIQSSSPETNAGEPRFVLDGHLGRLTAYLRMLGLDCQYHNDYSDEELVQVSISESRILLTRDRRLLMHKTILHGCLVRSLNPEQQLLQVMHRFMLKQWIRPFQRCLLCNHMLTPIEKGDVLHRLKPLTKKYFDEFHTCLNCHQIYWKGSHYERMLLLIDRAISSSDAPNAE